MTNIRSGYEVGRANAFFSLNGVPCKKKPAGRVNEYLKGQNCDIFCKAGPELQIANTDIYRLYSGQQIEEVLFFGTLRTAGGINYFKFLISCNSHKSNLPFRSDEYLMSPTFLPK